VNVWIAMCGCVGCENAIVAGKQWRDLLFSPKRDWQGQTRVTLMNLGCRCGLA